MVIGVRVYGFSAYYWKVDELAEEDPVEQRIAWFLMLHGAWSPTEEPEIENGRLVRVKYICEPPDADDDQAAEAIAHQGCAIVGSLSSMYSTLYNEATLTDTGELRSLRHEPDPGSLAELIPADYWARTTRDLPIWKLRQVGILARAQPPRAAGTPSMRR